MDLRVRHSLSSLKETIIFKSISLLEDTYILVINTNLRDTNCWLVYQKKDV